MLGGDRWGRAGGPSARPEVMLASMPRPRKGKVQGAPVPTKPKKKVVYGSGTCDMSHLISCNFLSFEIFDWIQCQRDHRGPQVHESPL